MRIAVTSAALAACLAILAVASPVHAEAASDDLGARITAAFQEAAAADPSLLQDRERAVALIDALLAQVGAQPNCPDTCGHALTMCLYETVHFSEMCYLQYIVCMITCILICLLFPDDCEPPIETVAATSRLGL